MKSVPIQEPSIIDGRHADRARDARAGSSRGSGRRAASRCPASRGGASIDDEHLLLAARPGLEPHRPRRARVHHRDLDPRDAALGAVEVVEVVQQGRDVGCGRLAGSGERREQRRRERDRSVNPDGQPAPLCECTRRAGRAGVPGEGCAGMPRTRRRAAVTAALLLRLRLPPRGSVPVRASRARAPGSVPGEPDCTGRRGIPLVASGPTGEPSLSRAFPWAASLYASARPEESSSRARTSEGAHGRANGRRDQCAPPGVSAPLASRLRSGTNRSMSAAATKLVTTKIE